MKKTIIILSISLFFNNLYAQVKENIYAAGSIPEELLKDAHAVVRQYNMSFTVKDMGTAIEKEHKIITILNEKGKHNAEVYLGYDKLTEIDDIEAAIFDAAGKLVRNMKKKDIYDFKPYTEDVSDSRVKRIDFPHLPYPYTIEYTVTTINKRLLFYPNWHPVLFYCR